MSIFVTVFSVASIEEYIEELIAIFKSKLRITKGSIYKKTQNKLIEYLQVMKMRLLFNRHIAIRVGSTGCKAAPKSHAG